MNSARPILKWAGGKRQLVDRIVDRLPERIGTYFEPFVGGAAVFFALAEQRRFTRAVLSDTNEELISTYEAIRDDVDGVIKALRRMRHSEDEYYRIRQQSPRSPVRRAARMIYLNRTGYNGLYRVNRAGRFNVPFGRYKKPNICDEQRLRAASKALASAKLLVEDFESVVGRVAPGDAVYFDPPYVPLSKTANFAHYQSGGFDLEAHHRLAQLFGRLTENGVNAVLSNSDTPETRRLFGDFEFEVVRARRNINCHAGRRGQIGELLVFGSEQALGSRQALPRASGAE